MFEAKIFAESQVILRCRVPNFGLKRFGRDLVLVGKGSGHGVGLCQWGMKEMAELGYSYEAIVRYYYPGTELMPLSQVNLFPPADHASLKY